MMEKTEKSEEKREPRELSPLRHEQLVQQRVARMLSSLPARAQVRVMRYLMDLSQDAMDQEARKAPPAPADPRQMALPGTAGKKVSWDED